MIAVAGQQQQQQVQATSGYMDIPGGGAQQGTHPLSYQPLCYQVAAHIRVRTPFVTSTVLPGGGAQ